ncbi:MAG: OsmC family protein [Demequinaceae bacterium]|nr:OsmC family protein [Demequinaceae bacterium]
MTETSKRPVTITRESLGSYLAANGKGATLRFGSSTEETFSPVELLLVAVAGCSGMDLDYMTSRRAEPLLFKAVSEADYVKDETGNVLRDIRVTFSLAFPEGEGGDKARARIASALKTSHDRTCTVSRTIEAGTKVTLLEA